MNETLDKAFPSTWTHLDYEDITLFSKKFAELIVLDCIKLLDTEIGRLNEYGNSVDDQSYKADVDMCIGKCIDNIMNIQEHFGVQ